MALKMATKGSITLTTTMMVISSVGVGFTTTIVGADSTEMAMPALVKNACGRACGMIRE